MKFIVFAFLLVFPFAALAGDRIALVIGNDRYANLRDLKNAGADADSVADALEALGFTVFRERNRDLRRMRRALEDMEHDGAGAEVALVYFAGHGFEVSGDNRLVPVDGDPATLKSLMDTSVSLGDVRDMVARIAEVGIVLIDACREDPLSASGAGRGGISLKGQVFQPGFASVEKTDGTLIGFATAPGDTASDGADGHSPFATALVRHLGVPGLEVRSVLTLVQQEVYDRTRGDQLPYVESALPRLFFAAQASDDLPERERLLLAMAGLSPDLRAEVEQAAAAGNMPLAPLYGAMIGAGLDKASASDRASKLADAARAYAQTRDRLRSFAAKDDEVTRLRDVAAQKLDLGDFTGAIAALDLAVERDRTSGERLESNLITRRLSEAESLALKAGVAETALDYDVAVAALGQAAALHARIAGLDVSDADRRKRTWLLADLGDLHVQLGNSGAAALRFSEMQLAAMARLERSPDNLDAERDLSVSHNKIGNVQVAQGDLPGARGSFEAGLAIRERLVASDQGNAVWQRDLAVSHSKIGDVQVAQGDLPGARVSFEAGLAIANSLAASDPGNGVWQRDLSVSYEKIGNVQVAQGDLPGARASFEAGLAIVERLAASDPGHAGWQRDLSVSHNRIGDVQVAQGDLPGARASYEAALAIRDRLAASDQGNTGWQRDLSVSHSRIGNVQVAQGDLPGARASYEAGLAIVERLAASDPGNAVWQRDLSVSHNKIGDVQVAQGDLPGARASFEAALAIRERLVASDPGHVGWQRDLSVSHSRIGNVQVAQGDLPGARASFEAGLAIAKRLAASDSGNAGWQRDLAVNHNKIGDVQVAQGDLPGARASFEAGLAIVERLAASDPGNAGWQRDLSVSHDRIGNVQVAQGELAGARASYMAGLAIRERLVASNPGHAVWQRDLIVSYFKLAGVGPTPRAHYLRALEVTHDMQARGILAPRDAYIPGLLQKRIDALPPNSP